MLVNWRPRAGEEAVGTYLGEGLLGRGLVATVHDSGLVLAEGLDSQDGAGVVFGATRFATNDIDGVVALLTDDAGARRRRTAAAGPER